VVCYFPPIVADLPLRMRLLRRPFSLRVYVAAVCAVGLPLAITQAALLGRAPPPLPAAYWLLAALLLVSDLFPVGLAMANRVVETTTSSTFALALLLGWGTRLAVVAFGAASVIADIVRRKPARKTAFNLAQLTISLTAASLLYQTLPHGDGFTALALPAFAAAAVVFGVINDLLMWGIVACTRSAADDGLRGDLVAEALTSAMLFGMAPVALAVAQRNVWFIPLLLLPMAAVSSTSRAAFTATVRRLRAEALLRAERQTVEALHVSDRLKRDLLATVSHELRTPLTAIRGALVTLQRRGEALDLRDRAELLAIAMRQADLLADLVEELLAAARFDSPLDGGQPSVPVDLADTATAAVQAAQRSHPGLPVELATDGPLPVRVAPQVVLRVLANLLDNAAKHTPPGTPVRLEVFPDGQLVVLAVEDQGPGVPAGQRERVFEQFVQLDSGPTRSAGGLGLGLYIARRLARDYGGDLLVVPPRHGHGARFELQLPRAVAAASSTAIPQG
jgi:signal transduction histidine kinase